VPGLAVVLVGDDPASQVYVRNKMRQTLEAGMRSFDHVLPASTSQDDLLALVARLNADPLVDGILVQLPLPPQIDAQTVIEAIDPAKDVDGFHPVNAGRPPHRRAGFQAVHAAGVPAAGEVRSPRSCRPRRGGGRALRDCRQADGAAALGPELHRHRGAFQDP
jgi:5,10-methylene-tetrahydrofolate dehydrogenase/methenyl tetrahydrofolate cyclohydrolase